MTSLDADQLPVGFVRLNADGTIAESNAQFRAWAESDSPEGRPLSDFLVPVDDFLDDTETLGMVARPDRPDRAAFVIRGEDELALTIVDATERYAAGRALRTARTLADRTQTRLQLIIDSSIEFANSRNEEELANILASTAAAAYGAEDATVYLTNDLGRMERAAGSNPFEEVSDFGSALRNDPWIRAVLKVSGEAEATALDYRLGRLMTSSGVHAIIAAPLQLDGEILGVFGCFFHHPRQFDDEATPLAEALAGQAAQALTGLRLRRRLEHAAMHDDTTGLPNRRGLDDEIERIGDATSVAILFIDLDGFKGVNDYLGHQQGDEVLREVARRLQSIVRAEDLVVRYGGDEFVVVCQVTDEVVVADLADRIRKAIQTPYWGVPADLTISASIGVATSRFHSTGSAIDRLIRMADQAMYEAKLGGGDQVVGA